MMIVICVALAAALLAMSVDDYRTRRELRRFQKWAKTWRRRHHSVER